MDELILPRERITRKEIDGYKREVLEQSVLLAPQDVSKILSCSDSTVYRLVRSGRLTGYGENRGTKGLRILAAELRDYVKSLKINADEWRE
jgi:excisionase family DNA binding protein